MQPESIGAVLQNLEKNDLYWGAMLPEPVRFFDHPVLLKIQTESMPTGMAPPPNREMLSLARLILAGVESLLTQAEREYSAYHEGMVGDIDAPRIWIDKDALMDDGPTRWTVVVGKQDTPDFGTHIEFEGTELLEVWSGD